MTGLVVNDYLEGRAFPVHDAILSIGLGLKLRTDGKMGLAEDSENVMFYSRTTSHNKVNTVIYNREDHTSPGNKEWITAAPCTPGKVYNLYLKATNAAIDIGEEIYCSGDGRFDKATVAGTPICGIALEARAQNDGAKSDGKEYIKVYINPYFKEE